MFINFLAGVFIFLFGVCVGSFLNCVIYRLEEKKKITGRSFCPSCKHKLRWQDLVPVFSFLFLRGKCRYCRKKISWQYPVVEIATGLVFLLIFSAQGGPARGWNFLGLAFLFYIAGSLIIIFVYDLKHYEIPDKVLFPAIIVTLVFQAIAGNLPIIDYLLAVLVSAGFFFLIFWFSKGKWLGFGDVKLAVLMGFLLGFTNVLVALFVAFFLGAIIGIILMVLQKRGLKSEIPFGPFLVLGTFLAMLAGSQIIQWYLNIFRF